MNRDCTEDLQEKELIESLSREDLLEYVGHCHTAIRHQRKQINKHQKHIGVLIDNVAQLKETVKLRDEMSKEFREELEYQLQIAEQSGWVETAERLTMILGGWFVPYEN